MGSIGKLYALIGADTSDWDKKLKKFQGSLKNLGKELSLKLTAPIIAFGVASVKHLADFEQSMANAASVCRPTTEELKKMEEVARLMGRTTVFSSRQAADAMYYMASAGWKAGKIMGALPQTLQLAAATQADLAFTTETVIAAMNIFGLTEKDVGRVTNTYARAIGDSQAKIDRLSTSMTYVGPIAAGVGMQIEEVVAPLMALYNAGYEASMAGSSLRMAMADLLNPTKEAAAVLGKLKISTTDVSPVYNNFADIIDKLSKSGATAGDVMKIFGIRAGPAIVQLMKGGAEQIRTFTKNITGTTAAGEMAAIQIDTFAGSWKLLKGAMGAVMDAVAKVLNPILRELIDNHLRPLLLRLSQMPPTTKKVIMIIGGLVAALGPALLALSGMIRLARFASTGVLFMAKTFTTLVHGAKFLSQGLSLVTARLGGMGPLLLKAGALGAAAFAGWKLGRFLGEVVGTDKAVGKFIDKLGLWKSKLGAVNEEAEKVAFRQALIARGTELTGKAGLTQIEYQRAVLAEWARTGTTGSAVLDEWTARLEKAGKISRNTTVQLSGFAAGLKEMAKAAEGMGLEDMEAALETLTDAVTNNKELTAAERYELDLSRIALQRKVEAVKAARSATETWYELLAEFGIKTVAQTKEKVGTLETALARLRKEYEAGLISHAQYEKGTKAIRAEIDSLTGSTTDLEKWLEETGAMGTKAQVLAIEVIQDNLSKLDTLLVAEMITWEEYRARVAALNEELRQYNSLLKTPMLPKPSPERQRIFEEALKPENIPQFREPGYEFPAPPPEIGESWKAVGEAIMDTWNNCLSEMLDGTGTFADSLAGIWNSLAAGISKGLGDMASKGIAKLGANLLGSGSKLLGGALSALAPGIGSALGALGGAVFKGIGKLFGIKSKAQREKEAAEKAAKEEAARIKSVTNALKQYGQVSEDTAKKIVEAKKRMSEHAATSLYFADVIRDVGVTQKNINDLWKRAAEALDDVTRAGADTAAMTEELGEAFNELIEAARDLGLEGSAARVEFIIKVRESGTYVREVVEYVKSQVDRLPKALESLVAGYAKVGGSIEDMAALTLASFNAMIESGYTYAEVLSALSAPLSSLRAEYERLGLTADGALAGLFQVSEVAAANRELFDSLAANQEILEALGNSGWMTGDIMARLAENATGYYQSLLDQGVASEDALRVLAPQLEKMYQYAKAYGITLDSDIQDLIDQATAMGLVHEAEDVGDIEREQADLLREIRDELRRQGDRRGRGQDYDPRTGFQSGGIAWRPQMATLAENEPEAVLKLRSLKDLIGAARRPAVDMPKPVINVAVRIGEEEIENFIVRATQKSLNARRLRVPAESVS